MVEITIPTQLQENGNRFCLVRKKEKAPFEKDWQNNGYPYNDPKVYEWIDNGGNVGILTGYGIIIIDCDCQQTENLARGFPKTMVVGTSTVNDNGDTFRKKHFYFKSELEQKHILKDHDKHLGEIQARGQQCLIPPSLHPSGTKYEVLEDRPIATLLSNELLRAVSPFIESVAKTKRTDSIAEEQDEICAFIKQRVKISDVLRKYGFDVSRNPTKCLWHASQGEKSFSFSDDLWNCFNCGSGGNIFHLVMKHENVGFVEAKNKLLRMIQELTPTIPEIHDPTPKSDSFFVKSKDGKLWFIPKLLGEAIKRIHHFKTSVDNSHIYVFEDGVYKPGGKEKIKELSREILDKYATQNRVNETVGHVEQTTYDKIDNTPHLLNLKNGLLDLNTRELGSHDPTLFITSQIPIEYNPDVDYPQIKKFIKEVLDEIDVPAFQEWAGFCLWRDYTYHKALMLIGEGSNGKSTLLELLRAFVGEENITCIPLQAFERSSFMQANLEGKLANIYADLSDQGLTNTGVFKTLTGGDTVGAERKYVQGQRNFRNYAKLMFSTNKLPETMKDKSYAYFRRWLIWSFSKTFNETNKDPRLLEKITTKEELSGLLNWALDGLERLHRNGQFTGEMTPEAMEEYYQRLSSPVAAFIMDMVTTDPEAHIGKDELYQAYVKYCKDQKFPPVANNTLTGELKRQGLNISEYRPSEGKDKRKYCWKGIRLSSEINPDG